MDSNDSDALGSRRTVPHRMGLGLVEAPLLMAAGSTDDAQTHSPGADADTATRLSDPRNRNPKPPFPAQQQERPGQPAEIAPLYVLLASDEASFTSGDVFASTGGTPAN